MKSEITTLTDAQIDQVNGGIVKLVIPLAKAAVEGAKAAWKSSTVRAAAGAGAAAGATGAAMNNDD